VRRADSRQANLSLTVRALAALDETLIGHGEVTADRNLSSRISERLNAQSSTV